MTEREPDWNDVTTWGTKGLFVHWVLLYVPFLIVPTIWMFAVGSWKLGLLWGAITVCYHIGGLKLFIAAWKREGEGL